MRRLRTRASVDRPEGILLRFLLGRTAANHRGQMRFLCACHPERSEGTPSRWGFVAVGACPERAPGARVERAAPNRRALDRLFRRSTTRRPVRSLGNLTSFSHTLTVIVQTPTAPF